MKKIVLCLVAAGIISANAHADVQSEMKDWFNQMGVANNMTPSQVVKGQTQTTYTGGSVYMRTPVKNYNLANVQLPGIKAGCGGLDMTAGSFSFINSEQLTALFRQTANNAVGYAFMMAIRAISPETADLMQYLQDQVAKLNSMNLNSCQLAEGIVTTAFSPDSVEKIGGAITQGATAFSGLYDDFNKSREKWKESKAERKRQAENAVSADPNKKDMLMPTNITWSALRKSNAPDALKELMMSMVGTVVIHPVNTTHNPSGEKPLVIHYPANDTLGFESFVGKGDGISTSVLVMNCAGDTVECLAPNQNQQGVLYDLQYATKNAMNTASANISARTAHSFGDVEKSILLNRHVPVWRLTSIATLGGGSTDVLLGNYAKVIASEVAYAWFREMIKEVNKALANYKAYPSEIIGEPVAALMKRIDEIKAQATRERMKQLKEFESISELQKQVQWMHETMMRSMPTGMRNSVSAFGR